MGPARPRAQRVSGHVFDAGGLIAVEKRDRRVLRLLELAREDAQPIDVPAGVVAQVWRGGGKQAVLATFLGLDGITFHDLDASTARAVGELCAATGGSDVVDAHVALVALRFDRAVVTSDPEDLARYTAGRARIVRV